MKRMVPVKLDGERKKICSDSERETGVKRSNMTEGKWDMYLTVERHRGGRGWYDEMRDEFVGELVYKAAITATTQSYLKTFKYLVN